MIVIDASVGLKWIRKEEEYRDKAKSLYKNHSLGIEKIVVPELFFLEVGNALVTKADIPQRTTTLALKFIFNLGLAVYKLENEDLLKATKLAKKHSTSVYDMLYAVVAKQNRTTLITSDEKFIQKTGFRFVKHIKDL